MKKQFLIRISVAAFFCLLCVLPALAANIKIKGAVKDKLSKEPLIGATIRLIGTQTGAVTDMDGNFELNDRGLLEGIYDVEIKYIGYKEVRRKVRVENGKLVMLNLELETDAQELADVVVVAKKNRENENMLLLEQQKAVIAVQSVSVKELSRKGVSDAEGAVTKVSGVSKQDGVKNVFVRGLGDRYNATTFNGFSLPSEDPEYKNISLDFFGTDIIQSVGVNKAFSAGGSSDVGGAAIDIVSKELTGGGNFGFSLSGGLNTQTVSSDFLKLVAQGGKLYADGTAEKPIIFTANTTSPKSGYWGGIIINGKAPISGSSADKSDTGLTEIDNNYKYGGNVDNDNSGSLTYVQICYAGARSTADIEHNGLTLNGVGNGTKIENIYVLESADDAIEFFGGTVNVTNLLAVNPDDDMFDFTQGYSGTLKNCYGVWESGYNSTEADPRGIEADGNLDGLYPDHLRQSDFVVENMTIVNNAANTMDNVDRMQDVIKIRRGAKATIKNALVKGTGGTIDLIDMSDSKGAGNAASSISITNSLQFKTKLNGVLNTFEEAAGNTGADASLFSWTGYDLSVF